jgi:hypothetical protein
MAKTVSESNSKIIGSVYDAKGKPIAGAEVKCNGKCTRTLFDGTYKLENLAPSTCIVTVTQKGFQSQKRTIELGKNNIANLGFCLIPEEGFGKIYGNVLDSETGKPITSGGTIIMVLPSKNKQVPIRPKDGFFEFLSLPSGIHQVWASVLGYEDEFKKINLKDKEEKRVDFSCRKKESIEPPWG